MALEWQGILRYLYKGFYLCEQNDLSRHQKVACRNWSKKTRKRNKKLSPHTKTLGSKEFERQQLLHSWHPADCRKIRLPSFVIPRSQILWAQVYATNTVPISQGCNEFPSIKQSTAATSWSCCHDYILTCPNLADNRKRQPRSAIMTSVQNRTCLKIIFQD